MAHRTEGENFVLEDGKRRSVPSSLPANPATRLPAELVNMLQEEICNVVEKCGIPVASNASTDRANGWMQLYTAIFKSAHGTGDMLASNSVDGSKIKDASITSGKIKEIDLAVAKGILRLAWSIPTVGFTGFAVHDSYGVKAKQTIYGETTWSELNSYGLNLGYENTAEEQKGAVYANSAFGFIGERFIKYKSIPFTIANFDAIVKSIAYFNSGLPKLARVLHAEFTYKTEQPVSAIYDRPPIIVANSQVVSMQFDSLDAEDYLMATINFSTTNFGLSTTFTDYELHVWYAPDESDLVTLPTEVT